MTDRVMRPVPIGTGPGYGDKVELDFVVPTEIGAWMVVVVANEDSPQNPALFWGTFKTPEAATEWANDNVGDDGEHWSVVPIAAVPNMRPDPMDKLRETIAAYGGDWTVERVTRLVGCTSTEAYGMLAALTRESVLVVFGEAKMDWFPAFYLNRLRWIIDTCRPDDNEWNVERVLRFFDGYDDEAPGRIPHSVGRALLDRLADDGTLIKRDGPNSWLRNPARKKAT